MLHCPPLRPTATCRLSPASAGTTAGPVRAAAIGAGLLAALGLAGLLTPALLQDALGPMVVWVAAGALAVGALLLVFLVQLASAATRRRLALLSRLLDAAPDAQALAGPEGEALVVNAAFRALLHPHEMPPLEALRAACRDPADRAALERVAHQAAGGRTAEAPLRLRESLGVPAVTVEARPLAGWPGHVHWIVRLRADDLGMAVAERAPLGVALAGEDGTLLHANPALASLLGRAPAEMAGGRLHGLLARRPDGLAANLLLPPAAGDAAADGAVELAGRGGQAVRVAATQWLLEDGRRTLLFLRDLAPGPEALAELKRVEQRFQRFFQVAPIGLALVDAELRLTECNGTFLALAGSTQEEVQGRPIGLMFQKEQRAELLARLTAALQGDDRGGPVEARLRGPGGATVQVYVRRFDTDDGAPGLILHVVDMTAQKNLEAQFVQSQKMQAIGQLAGGVAHDFNNLLTAMIGFCDLLLLRHKPGDQSFSDIMQIKQNANRAANLVRQLLAFSRQQTLQPRVLNVTDVLAELSNLLRRLIGENIELRMIHGRDLGLVKVDQGQLEQVIINLAVNARDAMPGGGRLSIVTENFSTPVSVRWETEEMPPGEYVVVEVVDTGIGIPRENLQRIFEPFFSTKEVGSGTGLGLSTVYGIVRQTGGFIFVDSAPGSGAKFQIYLPRHDAAAAGSEAAPAVEAKEKGPADLTGIGTVLLVEDEDAVRVFGARALRNKGYNVLEARSGEAALELLQGDSGPTVDLIITDVVMPQMDGPTLIRQVLQFRPDVKVIFISGYTEDRFRHAVADGIPIEFLPKPFSLKQLASKVKEVLGG